jgi:hypothetical protein
MMDLQERYAKGYDSVPPLLSDGKPVFSNVAHGKGLTEVATHARYKALLEAAIDAERNGEFEIALWLTNRAAHEIGDKSASFPFAGRAASR